MTIQKSKLTKYSEMQEKVTQNYTWQRRRYHLSHQAAMVTLA